LSRKRRAIAAVDDLVEMVAAYGFDYRTEAEESTAARPYRDAGACDRYGPDRTDYCGRFSYSMSKPIFAAMHVADGWRRTFTDRIEVRRAMNS